MLFAAPVEAEADGYFYDPVVGDGEELLLVVNAGYVGDAAVVGVVLKTGGLLVDDGVRIGLRWSHSILFSLIYFSDSSIYRLKDSFPVVIGRTDLSKGSLLPVLTEPAYL